MRSSVIFRCIVALLMGVGLRAVFLVFSHTESNTTDSIDPLRSGRTQTLLQSYQRGSMADIAGSLLRRASASTVKFEDLEKLRCLIRQWLESAPRECLEWMDRAQCLV